MQCYALFAKVGAFGNTPYHVPVSVDRITMFAFNLRLNILFRVPRNRKKIIRTNQNISTK